MDCAEREDYGVGVAKYCSRKLLMFAPPEAGPAGMQEVQYHVLHTQELATENHQFQYVICDGCESNPLVGYRYDISRPPPSRLMQVQVCKLRGLRLVRQVLLGRDSGYKTDEIAAL